MKSTINYEIVSMKDYTPNLLSQIAIQMLGIQDGDTVADLCCGDGNFLREVAKSSNDVELYGSDIDVDCCKNAQAQLADIDAKYHIECNNMFEVDVNKSFNRVFIHPPFGMKVKSDENARQFFQTQFANNMKISPNVDMGLMCAKLAFAMLSEGGKAFVLAPAITATRKTDLPLRRLFVDSGIIEAVVTLPRGIFETSGVSAVAYVISKNNKTIKFVSAKSLNMCRKKYKKLQEQAVVDEITEICATNNDACKVVGLSDVKGHQYSLSPDVYLWKAYNLKNPVKLGDLSTEITRRAFNNHLDANDYSYGHTTVYSVKIADMEDGLAYPQLAFEEDAMKVGGGVNLKDGDVLVSKIASPVKVAIYEETANNNAFAQENIYVVRVDQNKINPHYLSAFLNSEIGAELLRRKSAGSYIPAINLSDLKELEIPLLDMSEQERIGEEFKLRCEKLKQLRRELKTEQNQLKVVCSKETILEEKEIK